MNITSLELKSMAICGLIGGSIGYLIGRWYTENFVKDETIWDYECFEDDPDMVFKDQVKELRFPEKNFNGDKGKDYTKYFRGEEEKGDLAVMASKYIDNGEKKAADEMLEEIAAIKLSKSTPTIDDGRPVKRDIVEITAEDYADGSNGYEKVGLYYYENDQVVVDEMDDVVADTTSLLGLGFESYYGKPGFDDEIYIRNHIKRADYEVIRLIDSYGPQEEQKPKINREKRSHKKGEEEEDEREDT